MRSLMLGLLVLCSACAPKSDDLELAWDYDALAASGEVHVMPGLTIDAAPGPRYDSYVTASVPAWRQELRRERASQVRAVPAAFAKALPGALNAELRGDWDGRFRTGSYRVGARERLSAALRANEGVDSVLSDLARRSRGDAVLVTWVRELDSTPLTATGFPGDVIHTPVGPVVVDLVQEQHAVSAVVGAALVSSEGHVLMRLEREADGVVSTRMDEHSAAHQMARDLAQDMVLVWPRQAGAQVAMR